ncbi:hypothetical protein [Leuconostoc citreum]|uniref:hypothetical protein n=1 Tax=Leuconostoc citreum TaxID=33964 RepID=UPI001FAA28C5|nr:hypothetical protein [Leuconostoc citreum]
MAWYSPQQGLTTDYMMIEQNVARPEELLSWRDCASTFKPIHLQAYRNDYKDGDYDYFFHCVLQNIHYPILFLIKMLRN